MEIKEMKNPKEEKETTNLQTTKPESTQLEKPKEKEEASKLETTKPKSIEMEKSKEEKATPKPQIPQPKTTEEMEKTKEEKQTQIPVQTTKPKDQLEPKTSKHLVWDCESSLYDSFELKSFEKQLDSAITARTLSMPHLSDHRKPPPPQQQPTSKKPSKISRSLQKFIRNVFRPKQQNNSNINNSNKHSKSSSWFRVEKGTREGVYYVYDTSGALTTIPEVPESVGEFDGLSPDLKSFVRRTASDRFAPASLGISCA